METIYRWFISLYGSNLAEHLSGWDEAAGDYINQNLFSWYGIIALISASILCGIYYYVINHPRFNRWWSWVVMLLINAVGNFIYSFFTTFSDVLSENLSSDIANVSWRECLGFGFTNFIISALFFVLISFAIHWGSRNCKYSPFIKF